MVLLSDELYELVVENIEDKGVREQVFEEQVPITCDDRDALCSALETDISYWEDCIRKHPNEKEEILNHMRKFIKTDEWLMNIFHL